MVNTPTGVGWWKAPAAWARNAAAALRQFHANETCRAAAFNLLLIGIWYTLSTALGIYNKTLLGKKHGLLGKGAFPAPLFMSGIQFFLQFVFAKLVFWCEFIERSPNAPMDRSSYWKIVVPNGILTGTDIGFSNKSLVYITMSFYTMCKSTVPIFLLLCAFMWRIERPSWELGGVVSVIVLGLVFLVKGEAEFNLLGFLLVMSASAMSGVRFTLTQVSLHGHEDAVSLGGPLEVLELLTPIMSITSLSLSVFWEQLWTLRNSPYLDSYQSAATTLAVVAVGALMAFIMVWTEYKVIQQTSALTFMIAGTCKEVVTVLVAVLWFHDSFGPINGVGLVIVILGVILFNIHKWKKMKETAALEQSKLDGGVDDQELEPLVVNSSGAQQPSAPGLTYASAYDKEITGGGVLTDGNGTVHSNGSAPVPVNEVQVVVSKSSGGGWSSKGGAMSPSWVHGRHKADRSDTFSDPSERDTLLTKP